MIRLLEQKEVNDEMIATHR
jgi:hypothetical protein